MVSRCESTLGQLKGTLTRDPAKTLLLTTPSRSQSLPTVQAHTT